MKRRKRCRKHYRRSQKILLVGEGNFSFSASLARAFRMAVNMVATSLDSKDTLLTKYGRSCEQHLQELKKKGWLVLHEVDVNDMNQHPTLKYMKFDVIVFNFPHAGHFGLQETQTMLKEMHKDLLRAFFRSARELLEKGGEVHVAHRDDSPYNKWKIEELARENDLVLKEKVVFKKEDYPGYENKRGSETRANGTFPLKECFTFKFCLETDNND
ncbi:hypothetical protein L484_006877 [Morus notabilis]|uniref:25S rRNA (uridine-N(3))-methyltransferase BMT5-like domain-containing protein n=1 Tax=Morus notabilis TaxID=981085 RepID=W9SL20_9ROSA|nr:heavy metal-associated isoprenylated plant protein 41 [Morus notabilis]EXC15613.1 hypothetical protein L484_006877 [Morus notabilis]